MEAEPVAGDRPRRAPSFALPVGPFTRSDVVVTLGLFLAGVLLWSAAAFGVELLLGGTALPAHRPGASTSLADAVWHVVSAFVLVLPTRRRFALVLAPLLALGLDVDHLFGSVFPTVVNRQAHAVLFVVLVALGLVWLRNRTAGFLAAGAVLAHIGVDGGGFPLFAPFSTAYFPLSFPEQVLFCAAGSLLFLLAVAPVGSLREARYLAPLMVAVTTLAVVLAFAWPYILPFTRG